MSISNYVVIDTVQLKCVNIILWDGESAHTLEQNLISQLSDNTINIGDTVSLTNGVYIHASSPLAPTAVQLFSVDQFKQDLLGAFVSDPKIFQYYAVIIDLASFQNFSAIKTMIAGLLAITEITQDEVNTFNAVLMNQNIDLSTF